MHALRTLLTRPSAAIVSAAVAVGMMAGKADAWHHKGQVVEYVAAAPAPVATVSTVAVATPVVAATPVTLLAVPVATQKHHHFHHQQAFLAAAPVAYQVATTPTHLQATAVGASLQATNVGVAPTTHYVVMTTGPAATSTRTPFDDDDVSVASGAQYPMLAARLGDPLRVTALKESLRSKLNRQVRGAGGLVQGINWGKLLWNAADAFIKAEFGIDLNTDPVAKTVEQLIRDLLKEEGIAQGGSGPVAPPANSPTTPPAAAPTGPNQFSFTATGVITFPGGFPTPGQTSTPDQPSTGTIGGDADSPAARPPTR